MDKIKYAIVGSGWRSKFYIRIAQAYQNDFQVTAMLVRSSQKAESFKKEFGINVTTEKNEFLESKPDFIVVAVSKDDIFNVTKEYSDLGIPVLAETPAGIHPDDLNKLWNMQQNSGAKIQIAEQYHLYPSYQSILREANSGKLGQPQSVFISCVHDYHAVSLFRRALGIKFENFKIFGKSYKFNITETDSRDGLITDGRVNEKTKEVITIEFEDGKTVFYNFSGVQYHSLIRSRHFIIQGSKGEINNQKISYVNNISQVETEDIIFTPDLILPEDELAISKCLTGMKEYILSGKEFYPLSEALQDAYISILMHEAVKTGQIINSEKQIWS